MDSESEEQTREEIRRKLERSQSELIGDADKPPEERRDKGEGEPGAVPPPAR